MSIKKISAVILCLALVFSLTACANSKKEETEKVSSVKPLEHSMNILAFAEKGEIPELPFKVGTEVDKVKKEFKNHIERGSEIDDLIISEGEKTVWLDGGNMMFCYEKANENSGVSVIIAREYAYDFSLGGVYDSEDIITAVASDDYTLEKATDKDAFFLPVIPNNTKCLTYSVDKYALKFIFIDEFLSAVTLTDTSLWTN